MPMSDIYVLLSLGALLIVTGAAWGDLRARVSNTSERLKKLEETISKGSTSYYVPRTECELAHNSLDARITKIERVLLKEA